MSVYGGFCSREALHRKVGVDFICVLLVKLSLNSVDALQ